MTGQIGDLSFYFHKDYGYLARRKGGAKNGNISERTRENAQELGHASRTGKLIRRALRAGLHLSTDTTACQRLTKVLSAILKRDTASLRGERRVENGIADATSREQLKTFAFDENYPLHRILYRTVVYTETAGSFALAGFVPGQDLSHPQAATHVRLQAMTTRIDANHDQHAVWPTPAITLPLDHTAHDVLLQTEGVLPSGGLTLGLFSVMFLQEVNGELKELREGRSAGILGG